MNMESCSSPSQPAKMFRKTKYMAKDMPVDSIAPYANIILTGEVSPRSGGWLYLFIVTLQCK